ncbi:diacylglycerol kinase family protein [Fluviicola sp.]|uniref:diacylglycerol kinase family protein n=1 Tax=Fluviicola sp. TaxID=1917219 RepID=UPI0031D241D8
MKPSKRFSVKDRIKSFTYAIQGLKTLFREEHNARIHLLAALLVVASGFLLNISGNEWIALIIVMGLVFICEAFNTALEALCDYVQPEKHPQIKKVKDLAAAGVLISAISALITGIIIFGPKFMVLCTSN